jgi:hypothetical protein
VKGRGWFLVISAVVWSLLAAVLWGVLSTLEFGCKLSERDSGLWAECFAPVALEFVIAFAVVFLIDLVRTILAFRRMQTPESSD